MFKVFAKIQVVFFLVIFSGTNAFSQQNNTLFWMNGIPQYTYSNPSHIPAAEFYLGIPGLSSHFGAFNHSGFALRDLLQKDQSGNFYWNEDNMLSLLNNKNVFEGTVQSELLSFGWRSKSGFFSFNASENFRSSFTYPKDFLFLLIKGNDYFRQSNEGANLSGLALDAMHYRQFSFGYAHNWEDKLSAGFRVKALFGLSNIWFDKADLSLFTHPDSYSLLMDANVVVNASLPVNISPIDSLDADFEFDFVPSDYLMNTDNKGVAFDFGLSWKPIDNLTLSASVLDMGFIDWKQNVTNYNMNGEFEFNGVDLNEFLDEESTNVNFDNLLDSIQDIFDIEETYQGYRTMINSRIIVGGAYNFNSAHSAGLLFKGELFHNSVFPSYTFSYNFKPVSAFAISLAYSVINNNFHNLGAGMHLNLGPLQFYLAGDNFLGVMQPHHLQSTNLQLGLNLVFGYRNKGKDAKPLYSW